MTWTFGPELVPEPRCSAAAGAGQGRGRGNVESIRNQKTSVSVLPGQYSCQRNFAKVYVTRAISLVKVLTSGAFTLNILSIKMLWNLSVKVLVYAFYKEL